MIDDARRRAASDGRPAPGARIEFTPVDRSSASLDDAREITARAGQTVQFFLVLLLAGMLLSQFVEEKSNKVLEVLAASVPIDSIFLGKLLAMLSASLVGIVLCAAAGIAALQYSIRRGLGAAAASGRLARLHPARDRRFRHGLSADRRLVPGHRRAGQHGARGADPVDADHHEPGALVRPVRRSGRQARTARKPGSPPRCPSPRRSRCRPGRPAARPGPDVAALAWQALWVVLLLNMGARLFRRNVLKSGKQEPWWKMLRRRAA